MKTRFCPSPTGYMHLGNARTALFSALASHKEQGIFLLRIEDTDQTRSEEQYVSALLDDLSWMGLNWDEGPGVGGDHAPYWQSQRQAIYDKYYETLISKNLAYPCYCSDEQLQLNRKVQRSRGQAPRYPGTCRHLTADDRAAKEAAGIKPTLRFALPQNNMVTFTDLVKGEQRFLTDDIGDFVIRRADGTSPFMYCNALDDALMGVTHVIRGEDHLTNTPRQILILQALELAVPTYAHISLILGDDGAPLSKRNGSQSIESLRDRGYFYQAVVNYLARLGHYYEQNDFLSSTQLADAFAWTALSRSPARFDLNQLNYWQHTALQVLNWETLWEWMGDAVAKCVPKEKRESFVNSIRGNITFPEDALHWANICFSDLTWSDDQLTTLQTTGHDFFAAAQEACAEHGENFKAIAKQVKTVTELTGKQLFLPLRLAITGEPRGPDMATLLPIIGITRVMQRFEAILHQLA